MNTKRTNEHSVTKALPRYELIDKDGKTIGRDSCASFLADMAKLRWPNQEQDPDRTGKGWDIQVAS